MISRDPIPHELSSTARPALATTETPSAALSDDADSPQQPYSSVEPSSSANGPAIADVTDTFDLSSVPSQASPTPIDTPPDPTSLSEASSTACLAHTDLKPSLSHSVDSSTSTSHHTHSPILPYSDNSTTATSKEILTDPVRPSQFSAEPLTTPSVPARASSAVPESPSPPPVPPAWIPELSQKISSERFNYASFDCGALILKANRGATSVKNILNSKKDDYMLNRCDSTSKFVIIELCEEIQVDSFSLANFELFSSTIRDFNVYGASRYRPDQNSWIPLGSFVAVNSRQVQTFKIRNPNPGGWSRYLKFEFLTHHGSEYYCPLSFIAAYGVTMMEEYKESDTADAGDLIDPPAPPPSSIWDILDLPVSPPEDTDGPGRRRISFDRSSSPSSPFTLQSFSSRFQDAFKRISSGEGSLNVPSIFDPSPETADVDGSVSRESADTSAMTSAGSSSIGSGGSGNGASGANGNVPSSSTSSENVFRAMKRRIDSLDRKSELFEQYIGEMAKVMTNVFAKLDTGYQQQLTETQAKMNSTLTFLLQNMLFLQRIVLGAILVWVLFRTQILFLLKGIRETFEMKDEEEDGPESARGDRGSSHSLRSTVSTPELRTDGDLSLISENKIFEIVNSYGWKVLSETRELSRSRLEADPSMKDNPLFPLLYVTMDMSIQINNTNTRAIYPAPSPPADEIVHKCLRYLYRVGYFPAPSVSPSPMKEEEYPEVCIFGRTGRN
ncbi:UNC-like C-terminal-domain-containing protein [Polychytrium aggregatum]|uniref:UNC-like C-terminal-domain-containing protein n=1 Tax=Polychytrium aggregatum TaxID=110093 RepID=UPI0022FEE264|nr:UNC-like C-terminal-domain-containing protein [Polychytrium aggregatum]KAI9193520.1 UNC-like C-terminal-domain-containing protein [Polychytrium aggregatum]